MVRTTAIALVLLVLLLAGCEGEPGAGEAFEMQSRYLGLPDRVGPTDRSPGLALTSHLKVPVASLVHQSPDSLGLMASGQPLRITATLPPIPARDLFGLRLTWRGTLGGELGLSWRTRRAKTFRRAIAGAEVPGNAVERTVEIGFGPARILGPSIAEVGIELPRGEVGPVTLSDVRLLLRPGRVLTRVDLDGAIREVLVPGPAGWLEWDFVVPAEGRVTFDYATRPEMRISHGDGTRFVAEVLDVAGSTLLLDRWLSPFAVPDHTGWQVADLDLAAWAGERITLRLGTRAGPDAHGIFPASAQVHDDAPLFTVPRVTSRRDDRPNVLLIVIDTLRRDALGAWGGGPSPVLDSLAARGVRFDRAWATGSWTHPSTASLLSGWLASKHRLGFGPPGTTRLAAAAPFVAQDFRDEGWATAAVSNNKIVSVEAGFAEGFVAFDETSFEKDQLFGAQRVVRSAREWLDDHAAGPFFLYLHFFDPHDRYQAPPPFTRMHVDLEDDARIGNSSVRGGRVNAFLPETGVVPDELTVHELQYLRDLYRGEVSYVDHWIGKLLAHLEAMGRLDNTIVVVTSDHGEEFREHGGLKHGETVYEELLNVPLIVRLPEDELAGTVCRQPVSLVDLPATLRSLAELSPRPGDTPWVLAPEARARPLVAENWPYVRGEDGGAQRSLVHWPLKLIVDEGRGAELFDLSADPGEQSPVEDPGQVERMAGVLDSITGGLDPTIREAPVDPELLEKLKAMGYVR